MIFKPGGAIVVARGEYQGSGRTKDFKFSKPGAPITSIQKLNAKSVYWGVLHPDSVTKWEPPTRKEWMDETVRQMQLLIK